MDTMLATLMLIPMEVGLALGMLGVLPALSALAGKPPTSRGQLAFISCAFIAGAIGMAAGMTHLMLNTAI